MELYESFINNAVYIWLAVAVFFMALEAFGAVGVGFFFAGISALLVAILIELEIVAADNSTMQLATWFGATAIIGWALWKPMKRWRLNPNAKDKFHNIVGSTAEIIGKDLVKGQLGEAKWSGTVMKAEISEDAATDVIKVGEHAEVKEVRGTVLILTPK